MRCSNCDCEIRDDDARFAFEEPYCEDCFSDLYNYCSGCDTVIRSDRTYYDQDGNPFCEDCHENQYDEDCPDNPDVFDSDRKLILELSRNWLLGKEIRKILISINKKDFLLQKIRDKVGLVESSLYIFGLQDRDEYQLSVSPNLIDQVKEFILFNGLDLKVIEGIGCNRLGISYTLRKENLDLVVNLIKQISQVKELVEA
ncbi:MAG: hypothetical protein NTZ27_04465 [Ignavibacteriales bacterium]|nr:hypothetical protein [Ignavibacteriales bacterium]